MLQVLFPRLNNISLVVNQTSSQPVCLPVHQFYSQNYYAFFYDVYHVQCLFLENNIQTFTVTDGVQR